MVQWDPRDYAANSGAQLKWAHELIQRLALRGDESILDIGCGDGKITAEFAGIVPRGHVLGIDSSPEMIDYARAAFPPERFANLEFRHMDARQIETSRLFDLVFSNAVLHWVGDQRSVVLAIARALRPGGRVVISCGGRGNAARILETLETIFTDPQWRPYFEGFESPYHFLAPDDYAPWLAEAGLDVVKLELVEKDMTYPNEAGLAAWIRTTWFPYTQRLPERLRPGFIDEVVARYLAHYPKDASGVCHVGMVRLEVEAIRK